MISNEQVQITYNHHHCQQQWNLQWFWWWNIQKHPEGRECNKSVSLIHSLDDTLLWCMLFMYSLFNDTCH